jgi:glycosyltransferase involved in cell wall biosynthesis
MKILSLCPFVPWPPYGGGKIRIAALAAELRRRGHSITEWCCTTEPLPHGFHAGPFSDLAYFPSRTRSKNRILERVGVLLSSKPETAWHMATPEFMRALARLSTADYDVVMLEQVHLAPALEPLARTGIPTVLVAHNVEHDVRAQEARLTPWSRRKLRIYLDSRRLRRLEARTLSSVDRVICVSDDDRRLLEALGRREGVWLIPNGVDTTYFNYADHSLNRGNRLLFSAHLGYPPNRDACLWLCREIMPVLRRHIPAASLTIVGYGAGQEIHSLHSPSDGVEVVGAVEDVRPYMLASDVFVIPLRFGGGTRLKALEAMAAGLPIMSTPIGIKGLDVQQEDLAELATTSEAFASGTASLMHDLARRADLSSRGRAHVVNRYDWKIIANLLVPRLAELAMQSEAGDPAQT